jgi:hypothetical protein
VASNADGGNDVFDSEPFGQRAVRLGLATSEQVRQALETQNILAQKSGMLGEILVEMGWLDAQDYMKLVQRIIDDAPPGGTREEMEELFVKTAVADGIVEEGRIEQAKRIQTQFKLKNRLIGQIMVEMGHLSSDQLDQILNTYDGNDE